MMDNSRLLFRLCIVLFAIHQFLERGMQVRIPLLDNYLDPLLFMPVLLHLITAERRFFTKTPTYKLPVLMVAVYIGIVSILAEVVFPHFNPKLFGDPIDVCLYVLGAGLFVLAQGRRDLPRVKTILKIISPQVESSCGMSNFLADYEAILNAKNLLE